jgi:hypothetical protein
VSGVVSPLAVLAEEPADASASAAPSTTQAAAHDVGFVIARNAEAGRLGAAAPVSAGAGSSRATLSEAGGAASDVAAAGDRSAALPGMAMAETGPPAPPATGAPAGWQKPPSRQSLGAARDGGPATGTSTLSAGVAAATLSGATGATSKPSPLQSMLAASNQSSGRSIVRLDDGSAAGTQSAGPLARSQDWPMQDEAAFTVQGASGSVHVAASMASSMPGDSYAAGSLQSFPPHEPAAAKRQSPHVAAAQRAPDGRPPLLLMSEPGGGAKHPPA